jgi:hypothetical protein
LYALSKEEVYYSERINLFIAIAPITKMNGSEIHELVALGDTENQQKISKAKELGVWNLMSKDPDMWE